MDKKEVQKRVLKNGKPLSLDFFTWDENTNTFSTSEDDLVLDFKGIDFCNFITGDYCNFDTGDGCNFKTSDYCNFNTGFNCNFVTGDNCNFDTGFDCNFNTGDSCTFDVYYSCSFKTGKECVVVRRDLYEIIELKEGVKTILNGYGVKGYKTKKQKKELTMKELEKELGYEVKIVR